MKEEGEQAGFLSVQTTVSKFHKREYNWQKAVVCVLTLP